MYVTFPQQPMTEDADLLEKKHEAAEKCYICFKECSHLENGKVRDNCHYIGLYQGVAHNSCCLKYWITDCIPTVFYEGSGYDVHLFIKELRKKFSKDDIGVTVEDK